MHLSSDGSLSNHICCPSAGVSDGVTQQVRMILGVLVKRISFTAENDEKRLPNPSEIFQRSTSGAPWEPFWSLLTSILDTCSQKTGFGRLLEAPWEPKTAKLAPTWKPKALQNRCKNVKKSMSKNNMFLASFFWVLGPHFVRILGRFFEGKYVKFIKACFQRKSSK